MNEKTYSYIVTVEAESREDADTFMARRIDFRDHQGFAYDVSYDFYHDSEDN